MEIWTTSPLQTWILGQRIGEVVRPGEIICLSGDLGAGKTILAQGIGQGLGVTEIIKSPTFTLIQQYAGRLPLYHLDLYRIEQPETLEQLGWEELLWGKGVSLIEWPERLPESALDDFFQISLSKDLEAGPDTRKIQFDGRGEQGRSLLRILHLRLRGKDR